MKYELKLPINLKSVANLREHWAVKNKREQFQSGILKAAYASSIRKAPKLPIEIVFTRIAPRALDYDNLVISFKNLRDTLSDLLIPGLPRGRADNDYRLKWDYTQKKGVPKEYAVLITLTETSEDL